MTAKLTEYVYVIVRRDLSPAQQAVQACHAMRSATVTFDNYKRTHPHLVLCAVQDEQQLREVFERIKGLNVACCAYYEDDLGDAMTALATAPLKGKERDPLRQYRLL